MMVRQINTRLGADIWLWLVVLALSGWLAAARAQESLNQGPVLDIRVQRGEQTLPSYQVNRLRAGDQLMVRASAVPQLKQILMIALLKPNGQQAGSKAFDIDKDPVQGKIDITSDDLVPVIILAPQLRNLFGLYTSFSESEDLLKDVIRSDPQRFVALQTTDLINRAITTITTWLDIQVRGRSGDEAAQMARALAEKFGVRQINPDCFKGGVIRAQCVAIEMVTSKDFFVPSDGVLSEMSGKGGGQDLSGFLVSNLKVISQASDYLSNRFRDQYEFAPSFARPANDEGLVQLLSPVRNRVGNTKTAYVYVPGWYTGASPRLMSDDGFAGCVSSGRARVMLEGRLPLAPYWHSFSLSFQDPDTGESLGSEAQVGFNPTRDELVFAPPHVSPEHWPRQNQVLVRLNGFFGFDPIAESTFLMDLPTRQILAQDIRGAQELVSGQVAELTIQSPARSSCLISASLTLPGQIRIQPLPNQPERFQLDLSEVPAGVASLRLVQIGFSDLQIDLPIAPPRPSFALSMGPNPLLVHPSAKALQWAISLHDEFMTDDSAFSLRLRALPPLKLTQQAMSLQWRVVSESGSQNVTQNMALMVDLKAQEVRTRAPVTLAGMTWPGMINPIEFRVVNSKGVPMSPWQPLGKSVIALPNFKRWLCHAGDEPWQIPGERLELIEKADWVAPNEPAQSPLNEARFTPCPDGLCLTLDAPQPGQKMAVELHWLPGRRFILNLAQPPICP
jgi:hypothetical protein